jgi:hypothetical protein
MEDEKLNKKTITDHIKTINKFLTLGGDMVADENDIIKFINHNYNNPNQ